MMGQNSSRLARAIMARLEDPINGALKAAGGSAPSELDTGPIIPTWDINQAGMLDPKYKEDEQESGSFANVLNIRDGFTQPIRSSGSLTGVNESFARIVSPQGVTVPGFTELASVNSQYTRTQNSKVLVVYSSISFNAAGALAFATKKVSVSIILSYAPTISASSVNIPISKTTYTIGTDLEYQSVYYYDQGLIVPWDCLLYALYLSDDGTVFPANTSVALRAFAFVRSKNTMLPMW
jgi:hypothetical protein